MGKRHEHTLCWDCAKATSADCPWAESGIPVKGWRARPTDIRFACEHTSSFHVYSCPLFVRDGERGGLKKVALGGETHDKSNGRGDKPCTTDAVYRMAQSVDSGHLGSGNSPVADSRNRKARILSEDRDLIDLAYGVLERAVLDWKALEYGRKESTMLEKTEWVERDELVEFFFSKWFSKLCEPLHYSPEEIRAALKIPEEARWTIKSS